MFSCLRKHFFVMIVSKKEFLRVASFTLRTSVPFSSGINNSRPTQIYRSPSLPAYRNAPPGSRYCMLSPIEIADSKIRNYLSENNPRSFDEWQDARDFFYTEIQLISDVNYSSVVMTTLHNMNKFELAQSFIKYLENTHLQPNFLAYLKYISLCSKNIEHCGQEVILETFNKIQNLIDASMVLDCKTTLYVIQGLCATDRWKEAFNYIKKLPGYPSLEMKFSLASAAIQNENEFVAWDIVTNWINREETLNTEVIKNFLKYANVLLKKDKTKADAFILKLFQLLEQKGVVINKEVVSLIEYFFNNHSSKWNISYTKVSRHGVCDSCQKCLKLVELSNEEFYYLKEAFLAKSVKKNDIFINTTVEEFQKYIAFIKKHKPFHIVIDGLNVAYTTQNLKNKKNLTMQLFKVVEKLSRRSRKLLVLGRKHMSFWPQNIMRKIAQHASIFLTSNISQDDPFTIYAALASGPHTYIVTMDLMRDHMARLDDKKLIILFKKWQQSHQILVTLDENNDLKLTEPVMHNISIQGNMEFGWHIPYDDNILLDPYEELNNWLCIQKINA